MELIRKGFASVALLHSENAFQSLLLGSEDLNFLLVAIQLLLKLAESLVETVQFPFEMCSVVRLPSPTSNCALLLYLASGNAFGTHRHGSIPRAKA